MCYAGAANFIENEPQQNRPISHILRIIYSTELFLQRALILDTLNVNV